MPILRERRFSGSARSMTVVDGFIYNFLAMGVIFPWVYLWGPAAFPGADIRLSLLIAFAAHVPIAVTYSLLASVFPGSGGDYIYQTRTLGKLGAICVMSGFVVWILQWIALSGWLFSTLGLAPLFMSIGARYGFRSLTVCAVLMESPGGILLITVALAVTTVYFLQRGMPLFVRVQRILFALTLGAMVVMTIVFAGTPAGVLASQLNHFTSIVIHQLGLDVPQGMSTSFLHFVVNDATRDAVRLNPPFSWAATLGVVPIAWTSLQWSVYSVEQNAEIKGSTRLKNQLIMLVSSAGAVTAILVSLVYLENRAFSSPFLIAGSNIYWNKTGSPVVVSYLQNVLQPFPSVIAVASSNSIIVTLIIAAGFLANAFQVTCNCFIGASRILVRMAGDGLLPRLFLTRMNDGPPGTPRRVYWLYLIASLPVIAGYFLVSNWRSYTLGVTVACGYVFVGSSFALIKLPWSRVRSLICSSELRSMPRWMFVAIGALSMSLSGLMVLSYICVPNFRLADYSSSLAIILVILLCVILILIPRWFRREPGGGSNKHASPSLRNVLDEITK